MWQTNLSTYDYSSAQEQISRQKLIPYLWMGVMVLLTLAVFALISQSGIKGPDPLNVFVWFAFVVGGVLIAYRPRYGIYLILFLALVSDTYLTPAFPFTTMTSRQWWWSRCTCSDDMTPPPKSCWRLLSPSESSRWWWS